MRISAKTKLCAVIGDPVEHSLSPCIHNAAFQHLGLDYVYAAFTVEKGALSEAMQGVRSLGIFGLNVTMPHKVDIIPHLDRLDETAQKVGAVNTVLNDIELIGYNTDAPGAMNALKAHEGNPYDKKVVILGAGGASRSISFAIAEEAGELVILNRTPEKAEALASKISSEIDREVRWGMLSNHVLDEELVDAVILINATSVGMHPNDSETPVDKSLLREDMVVFDLVYNPLETRLLREAKSIGAQTIDGLTMLVYQGAASFEIWTERKAPVNVMIKAAMEELEKRRK
ncbi:MAG: shikimate dehydrogenase [Candidatus Bathyarchaeota archaeon]|nr:shikimate dehydrogenase [Candidatus Bathyarchaeota archaeon]